MDVFIKYIKDMIYYLWNYMFVDICDEVIFSYQFMQKTRKLQLASHLYIKYQ